MTIDQCKHLASRLNHVNFMLYGGSHPELMDAACALVDMAAALTARDSDIDSLLALVREERTQVDALRARLGVPLEPKDTLHQRLVNAIDLCREHRLMAERRSDWR